VVTVILRRLAVMPLLLFVVTLLVFSVVVFLPGDPAQAIGGDTASPEQLAHIRSQMHLDKPFLERYVLWVGGVLHGDLGESFANNGAIADQIQRRLPVTATLALGALLFALLIGLPGGLLAAMFPRRWLDRAVDLGTSLGLAMPSFWLATILVSLFAVTYRLLPSSGFVPLTQDPAGSARHLILPIVSLGLYPGAEFARQLRASMLAIAERPYIRTAHAKGLSPLAVMGKHALKNALTPALTVLGLRAGHLLAGSAIIESIFGMPGIGRFAVEAIANRDLPAIQGVVLVSVVIILVINLLVDVLNAALNPKVRFA
jgi:peptide/nickel transport system permease protein